MSQQHQSVRAPSFGLIEQKPVRPAAFLLALAVVGVVLSLALLVRGRSTGRHFASDAVRSPAAKPDADKVTEDEKDDPSQVDTIVLGDAADAPVPARRGGHSGSVHATILIHLPRFGDQVGLIPDSAVGHLLFRWLAAFNQASYTSLVAALPSVAPASAAAAQMDLRKQTGGVSLLSAKEIQPGVLVFRLRDQTPFANEVLGTLYVRPGSNPPAVASFSLRAVQ